MRKKLTYLPLFSTTLFLPALAHAAAPQNFKELSEMLIGILGTATTVLIALGFVLYLGGMSINITKFEEDAELRKSFFLWGIVALLVMVSIWGILALLRRTVFGE